MMLSGYIISSHVQLLEVVLTRTMLLSIKDSRVLTLRWYNLIYTTCHRHCLSVLLCSCWGLC